MISRIQELKISGRNEQAGRKQNLQTAANLSGIRAVIAAFSIAFLFFFGMTSAKAQSSASASFAGFDAASQGNWSGKYGSSGYVIANGPQSVPAYATFAQEGGQSWTWAASTTDVRALTSGSGRTATTWFSSSSFSMDINMTDGNVHQIAIYAVDFDRDGRAESFQVSDANSGALLDSRNISAFSNGTYAVWSVSGHVRVNVILTGGVNPVVSGIFFGGSSAPATTSTPSATGTSAAAQFLNANTTAEGNWKSIYGADGYSLVGGSQKMPSYATLTAQNESNWTWVASTSDPRALQGISAATTASTWYNTPSFSLDVNMTDGQSHQMALYALDWDLKGRAETIQIVDANSGSTLNSQSVTNFSNGIYLVWAISGHVKVNVTVTGGPNAVISGVFFGSALNANNPSSAFAPAITTQPASQTVTAGQSATFSVADTGTAPLTYQWTKNGVAISGANSSSYTTPATATTDKGSQFGVTVSNTAGSVTSSAAVLTVNGGTLILNASTTAVSFGQVNVSASSSQTVTLTNAGTAAVTISNVSVSGAGFNASGVSTGTVLAPGQSASLEAMFTPAASGNATGSITIVSNANASQMIALSGTAVAPVPHTVALSWSPSTSTVSGYNVYVSTVSGSGYTRLTSSLVPTSEYSDTGLQTAQTRYYVVTSVNSNGVESGYSSQVTAIVP